MKSLKLPQGAVPVPEYSKFINKNILHIDSNTAYIQDEYIRKFQLPVIKEDYIGMVEDFILFINQLFEQKFLEAILIPLSYIPPVLLSSEGDLVIYFISKLRDDEINARYLEYEDEIKKIRFKKYNQGKGKEVNYENEVKCNKQFRKDIDEIIQKVKELPSSRERNLSITKLQEAVMWLGMDLKRLRERNPYPNSKDPSNTVIEPTADNLKM